VITCPKCSKDNQDHYKFCLGCGAELPRDAAPKPFSPQTPPQGMKTAQPAPAPAPPPMAAGGAGLGGTVAVTPSAPPPRVAPPAAAPAPAPVAQAGGPQATVALTGAAVAAAVSGGATVICPQCAHVNAPSNLFCGSCGSTCSEVAAPP
jgi:hypothetical protein